jgi:hypothetical protein
MMHTNQNWDGLMEMRRQEIEREIRALARAAQVPNPPPAWQQRTGRAIAWVGRMLMQLGERVAATEPRRQTSLAR